MIENQPPGFTALLASLSPDPLTRGKQFERIVKWWLTKDPIWSRKIKNVWLWDEWPNYPGRDIGIDLVAEMTVAILSQPGTESPFVIELSKYPHVEEITSEGVTTSSVNICNLCGQGTLVARKGKYGEFFGCSRFPACRGPKKEKRSSPPTRSRNYQAQYSRRRGRYR